MIDGVVSIAGISLKFVPHCEKFFQMGSNGSSGVIMFCVFILATRYAIESVSERARGLSTEVHDSSTTSTFAMGL